MKTRHLVLAGVLAALVVAGGAAGIAAAFGVFSSPRHSQIAIAPAQPGGPGLGSGGFRRGFGGGRLGRDGGGVGGDLDAAATYLGISSSDVFDDLRNGKTLAEVAKAQGKSAAGLIDAMVAAQKQTLAAAVSAGRITQDEAQQFESRIRQRVTGLVNGGFGGGFRGRPRTSPPTARI